MAVADRLQPLPGHVPVKTANSGKSRLPNRPHAGPLDERPIVGEKESESYE
jgi:hypothetical protein